MLFPVAYAPSIRYLQDLVKAQHVIWDIHEHWIKQTIRNRCEIAASDGKLSLVIPIKHVQNKQALGAIEVDDKQPWRRNHWRTLKTCYQNAPYFQDYAFELEGIFESKTRHLVAFNHSILQVFQEAWDLPLRLDWSMEFNPYTKDDLRLEDWFERKEHMPRYYQVFQIQKPFIPNLSCFDLLFNEGPLGRNWILGTE